MSETQAHADIDLTAIPTQREGVEDLLEIIHDTPSAPAVVDRRSRRVAVFAVGAIAAGIAIGLPLGYTFAPTPTETAPAPVAPADRASIDQLLVGPLTTQPSTGPAPHDQQDLIQQVLTPH